jgi:hypothetical protein
MTDAPSRIWALVSAQNDNWASGPWDWPDAGGPDAVEYIRADARPITVAEAAKVLLDKMENPFDHPEMNKGDIDWQAVWNAFWEEADQRDAPAAMAAALRALSEGGE